MFGLASIKSINDAAARRAAGTETKTPDALRKAARAERAAKVAAGQRRAKTSA